MIYDSIQKIDRYSLVHPRFKEAFAFLKQLAAKVPPVGRYYPNGVENDAVFANVSAYSTNPLEGRELEAHHRYIDIQYLANGRELIYLPSAVTSSGGVTVPYSETTDAEMSRMLPPEECTRLPMDAGTFAVFFPPEQHAPCVAFDQAEPVLKIVVKVKMD